MKRGVWLVVGGLVTVTALLAGMASVWGIMRNGSTESERQTETYRRPASGIEVDLQTGDLSIVGQDAERVDVQREIAWSQAEPTVRETWAEDDTLRVDADCPNGFPPWIGGSCSVDYAARVPYVASVDTETTTGRTNLRAIGGDVRVSSTTGDVTGSDLRSNHVAATVTTGEIDLRFAEHPDQVAIESTTGDIVLEVPPGGAYDVDVEITTGDERIDIVQDPSAPRAITIHATTADVWVRYAS